MSTCTPHRSAVFPVARLFDPPTPCARDGNPSDADSTDSSTDTPAVIYHEPEDSSNERSTDSARSRDLGVTSVHMDLSDQEDDESPSSDSSGSWGDVQDTPTCFHFMCEDY